jgi:hypothetical protein
MFQVAWLESLFFLDSGSRLARGGLVAPKPRKTLSPVRSGKSSLYNNNNNNGNNNNDDLSGVSSRSLQIQSNHRNEIKQTGSSEISKAGSTSDHHAGLNKDLCSLAQQFFTNEGANKKPTKKPIASVKPLPQRQPQQQQPQLQQPQLQQQELQLQKPFGDPLPTKPERVLAGIPERASFQLFDETLVPEVDEEEDEDFSSKFGHLRRRERDNEDDLAASAPPPIPERSAQPKVMMLKLMKNATNVLRS